MRAVVTIAVVLLSVAAPRAHDDERTRVVLSFAADGGFVLELSHNPNWALLRLESFAAGLVPQRITPEARDARLARLGPVLVDRVVLWVDGQEVRPDSAEYVAARSLFRLRGRMPRHARTLRWLYGSVGDTYPLVLQRADGRTEIELIDGSNWSRTLDISGQFEQTRLTALAHVAPVVAMFAAVLWWRARCGQR